MSLLRELKDLRPYQNAAVEFVKETKRCALFVDPGLGKTAITMTAFILMMDDFDCGRVLILAPPRVAKNTWPEEFKKWRHTRDKSFVVIRGTQTKREKLMRRSASFHIMSMGLLPWLKDKYPKGTKFPYDAIVVDESSKVKNKSTDRWRSLNTIAHRVEYFVLLTGTPSPNGLHDLWAQLYLIDRGERLGLTLGSFRDRWFRQNYNGHGYKAKDYAKNQIEDLIADKVFTLREQDYANLPPRIYNDIVIEFEPSTKSKYIKFEKTYILESITADKKIAAKNGAAITNKLQQLANGIVYDDLRDEHQFHSLKLDALEELFDELSGQTVFLAYQFKSDAKRILERFKKRGAKIFDDSKATEDAWNAGEIPMLLVHPKSAAHGLNLQFGGHVIVWYGLTFSLEDYYQLNKRLHRDGQKRPVMIHHIIVKDTIDEDQLQSLNEKNGEQESMLNALSKRIKKYTVN